MVCFVCGKPVIPHGGYFKTQLFNGESLCHLLCKPLLFYEKAEQKQDDLFIPSPNWKEENETTSK